MFKNLTQRTQEVRLGLELPPDTLISGVKYNSSGKWVEAKLMGQHEAEGLYFSRGAKLKNVDPVENSAVILYKRDSSYELHVANVPKSGAVKISYTMEVLPTFENRKYSILYPKALDRKKFVEPSFSQTGLMTVNGVAMKKNSEVYLGYKNDLRCLDLNLPKTCRIIEVDVKKTKQTEEISYFSTRLSVTGKRNYTENRLLDIPLLILDPSGESISPQNCSGSPSRVSCRTPVKTKVGKWRFVFSLGTSKREFSAKISFENERMSLSSERRMTVGYARIEFAAKNGPNEIFVGGYSNTEDEHLEAKMRCPFSVLPKRPRMIFLVDTSWSANEKGIHRQLSLLKSIVKHTDDETIEVLAFNRFVHYLKLNPKEVEQSIQTNAKHFLPKNGSDLRAALEKVKTLTKKGSRPTLVYVMSDFVITKSYDFRKNYVLALPKNVVLHTVNILGVQKYIIRREESGNIPGLASQNRGIAVRLGRLDSQLDAESLHLVRPIRVENVKLGRRKIREDLREGTTFRLKRYRAKKKPMELKGKLWQRDYTLKAKRTRKGDQRLVYRRVLSGDSTTKEIIAFGKARQVVTRRQSLFGMERKGEKVQVSRNSWSGVGFGMASSHYRNHAPYHPKRIEKTNLLEGVFQSVENACQHRKKQGESYSADYKTLGFEIVSVSWKGEKESDWTRCMYEGIWATKLPDAVRSGSHSYFSK